MDVGVNVVCVGVGVGVGAAVGVVFVVLAKKTLGLNLAKFRTPVFALLLSTWATPMATVYSIRKQGFFSVSSLPQHSWAGVE